MAYIRTKATCIYKDAITRIGMFAKGARQCQQFYGYIDSDIFGLHSLGQGGAFGFRHSFSNLSKLYIGTILTHHHKDGFIGFGMNADLIGTFELLLEQLFDLFGDKIRRREILGNRRINGAIAITNLDIGSKFTDLDLHIVI